MSQPESKKNCIFCKIALKEAESQIVYEEDNFIVFKDIRPAAEFHVLVVPKKHYGPLRTLDSSHVDLITKMGEIGQKVFTDTTQFSQSDLLEGFHWPIVTVNHLHLHFIAPKQQMNCFKRIEFHSLGFGSMKSAIQEIEKKKPHSE